MAGPDGSIVQIHHRSGLQPIVATTPALAALTTTLAGHTRIGLDTEFLRERTYRAQLCLVQVATAAGGRSSRA